MSTQEEAFAEKITTLRSYVNPEKPIIDRLVEKADMAFGSSDHETLLKTCNRILLLAQEGTMEYRQAYSRRNLARKNLKDSKEDEPQDS